MQQHVKFYPGATKSKGGGMRSGLGLGGFLIALVATGLQALTMSRQKAPPQEAL
jgi:hypothetical protein